MATELLPDTQQDTDDPPADQDVHRAADRATTARDELPPRGTEPVPDGVRTTGTWLGLSAVTVLANLLVLGAATAAGASMTADTGATEVTIGAGAVAAATAAALLISTTMWAKVAFRAPGFAALWAPLGWGVGLVSLAGLLGAADLDTAVALAIMHGLTTLVAAHVLPRVLPRHAR